MPAKSLLREVPSPNEDSRFFIVLKRCYYPCGEPDLPINGAFSLLFLERMFFCRWTLQMPMLETPGFQIRVNVFLSNIIRILTPKNGGYWSRKGHSVEKMPFFEVFRNMLSDRWLHGFKTVNGRFTKSEFAKGKVSLRQRLCFVV